MNPSGKLVYAKLKEENGGLGYRIIFIAKRANMLPIDEEARRGNILRIMLERGEMGPSSQSQYRFHISQFQS